MQAQQAQSGVHAPAPASLRAQAALDGYVQPRYRFSVKTLRGIDRVQVPGGYVLPEGSHTIEVNANEVAALESLVEPHAALWSECIDNFGHELLKECAAKDNDFSRRPEDVRRQMIETRAKRTGNSPSAVFSQRVAFLPGERSRGPRPLVSVELIGDVAPIETPDTMNQNAFGGAIRDGLKEAIDAAVKQFMAAKK